MAEPKKKTVTKKTVTKKTSAESKPIAAKKVPAKKAPAKKSTVSKADSATVKKTLPSTPVVKKVSTKMTPLVKAQKSITKEIPAAQSETPKFTAKKSLTDMSIFTTILALSAVVLVVLGGYIYSRQARRMNAPVPAQETIVSEPQQIRISSAVALTPVVMSALEDLVKQIAIWPEEVLTRVTTVDNVAAAQSIDSDFYLDAQQGDMVFSFQSTSVLFRPSSKSIINTGIITE